jgi:DNA invertase Pin-like site-specific DNA recombinase
MHFHYHRVSTSTQETDMQVNALQGYPCDRTYSDEGVSGKNLDRPQFQLMLNSLREGDTVYCYSLSRIGRNTIDLIQLSEQFKKMSVTLVSHTEKIDTSTAMGVFFFTLMAALGELERSITEERRIQGVKTARENGVKFGRHSKLSDHDKTFIKSSPMCPSILASRYAVSLRTIQRIKKTV